MLSEREARRTLERLGVQPHKARGQNFLMNEHALRQIADSVALTADETALEIGPGLGFLTAELVKSGCGLYVAEIEESFSRYLANERKLVPEERAIHADVCTLALSQISPAPHSLVLAGNLPYSRTTDILLWAIRERQFVNRAVFLLQRDVVTRLAAPPGVRDTGVLSVQLHLLADVTAGPEVSPESFYPPPEVWSQVVSIRFLASPRQSVECVEDFVQIVRAGFSQRRKTIKNSLSGSGLLNAADVSSLLAEASVEERRRPESLLLEEWARLSNAWSERKSAALKGCD